MSKIPDQLAIEDMIAELEETVIILQGKPGNEAVTEQLLQQIDSLKRNNIL